MWRLKKVLAGVVVAIVYSMAWAGIVPVSVPNNYAPDGFYRYAPSTLVESGVRHVFYVRNVNSRVVVDGIYHAIQSADGTLSNETLVLSPADSTGTAWDSYHVADPSVIAGAFYYEGHTYRYLMAYLGVKGRPGDSTSDGAKCLNNKVGLAVSDSLTGGWVRMGTNPVVITEHLDWWGVGQPSLLSVDGAGKVALFYAGDYETRLMNLDFTDAAATATSLATKVGDQGILLGKTGVMDLVGTSLKMTITNADFAYDDERKFLYMIADTPDSLASWYDDGGQYLYITKAVSVYRTTVETLANLDLAAAEWEMVARFQPSDLTASLSTAARIHNSGFVRTDAGGLVGFQANVAVANVKNDALYTYRFLPVSWTEAAAEDGYIEFTATRPMNLRHFIGPKTKIAVDFALTDKTTKQQRIIGIRWHYGIYFNGQSKFSYQSSEDENTKTTAINIGLDVDTLRHTGVIDVPGKKFVHTTAGITNYTGTLTAPTTTTSTWPLFLCGASNSANGETFVIKSDEQYNAKAKIYGVKIWEDGTLVHDYQPQVQDGLAGLKDLVDGVFLAAGQLATASVANAIPGGNIPNTVGDAYLQTDGHQGITTDYKLTPQSRLVLDYAYVDGAANQRAISGGSSAANGGLYVDWYNNAAGAQIAFIHDGAGSWQATKDLGFNTLSAAPANNLFVRRSYSLDIAAGKYFVSTAGYTNETQDMKPPLPTLNATSALKFFHGNITQMAKVRFYGAKIYESGTLVRNYVPYVTNGVACLYETEVGTVFYNDQGTNSAAFVVGGNVTSVGAGDAYLESDGTQAIVLDYYSNSKTKLEIDFALNSFAQQTRIFGVDGGNSKAVQVLYSSSNCKFTFINNSTWTGQKESTVVLDALRHTAVIDRVNNTFLLTRMNGDDWTWTFTTTHGNTSLWPMGVFGGVTAAGGGFSAAALTRLAKMKLYAFRIYESGTLVHEFLPYKNGDTTGLYDTKTGVVKTNALSGGNPFALGGRGANGNADMLVVRPADVTVKKDQSAPLKIYAPGAIRYRWTVNGQELDETDGEISVPWMDGRRKSAVTVTPIYMVLGTETLGTPIPVTVTNVPRGMYFMVK